MKNCPKHNSGFTLIELLITIVIIGILSAFVIQSSSGGIQKARDSQRKSDISQYRTAIENYSVKQNGIHPISTSLISDLNGSSVCTTLTSSGYITSCPSDPQNGTTGFVYSYQTDSSGINYIILAKLERGSSGSAGYWYVCANGTSAEKSTSPSSSDCGF